MLAPCLHCVSRGMLCVMHLSSYTSGRRASRFSKSSNAVKLFTKWPFPWLGVAASCGQQLVMFDAQDARFRSIKLRPKQASCAVCGENPSVTQLVDYEAFCGAAATDKVGQKRQRRMKYLVLPLMQHTVILYSPEKSRILLADFLCVSVPQTQPPLQRSEDHSAGREPVAWLPVFTAVYCMITHNFLSFNLHS